MPGVNSDKFLLSSGSPRVSSLPQARSLLSSHQSFTTFKDGVSESAGEYCGIAAWRLPDEPLACGVRSGARSPEEWGRTQSESRAFGVPLSAPPTREGWSRERGRFIRLFGTEAPEWVRGVAHAHFPRSFRWRGLGGMPRRLRRMRPWPSALHTRHSCVPASVVAVALHSPTHMTAAWPESGCRMHTSLGWGEEG